MAFPAWLILLLGILHLDDAALPSFKDDTTCITEEDRQHISMWSVFTCII